jgi:hypothetical protein
MVMKIEFSTNLDKKNCSKFPRLLKSDSGAIWLATDDYHGVKLKHGNANVGDSDIGQYYSIRTTAMRDFEGEVILSNDG